MRSCIIHKSIFWTAVIWSCVLSKGAPTPAGTLMLELCGHFLHTYKVLSLTYMGYGDSGLNWWTAIAKWVTVFGGHACKTVVFMRALFLIIAWLQVSVPLNSWPVAYYRKGGTNTHLKHTLRSPVLGWYVQCLKNRFGVGPVGYNLFMAFNCTCARMILYGPWTDPIRKIAFSIYGYEET